MTHHPLDGLTDRQWTIVQSASLAVAALSFTSVTIALYWFSRTRRSFRHNLIMLLMSSYMLMSLWLIIFPIVYLKTGSVTSGSSFCQASGFFISVGIEASDVAILLIAIHTGIYVFRPQHPGRQSGLYPHRRLTFSIFAFSPLLMASLAFVNWPGYVYNGGYCYLPVRPRWIRLTLSWVPRCTILLTIVVLYAYIYIYAKLRMRRASAAQMPENGSWSRIPWVPPTSTTRHGFETSMEALEQQRTSSAATTMTAEIKLLYSRQKIKWNWPTYGTDKESRMFMSDEVVLSCTMGPSTSPLTASFGPIASPRQSYIRHDTVDLSPPVYHYRHQGSFAAYRQSLNSLRSSQVKSLANVWSIFCRGTSLDSGPEHNANLLLSHTGMDGRGMNKTRDKIRRQLRLLFIYPLVYMLMWTAPFVAHVMRWDKSEESGPFAVVFLSLLSLSVQGLVNSCLFCAVERPWIDRRAGHGRTMSKHEELKMGSGASRRTPSLA
ncbi:G protein-coupled glucose receptor regulating Gpa2-domain-containing protein [Colletotrichum cereale]|nr:G protein-coupled glucose receptor regulating Gpa2-domain-containing protein [Colletotrichum cereale]